MNAVTAILPHIPVWLINEHTREVDGPFPCAAMMVDEEADTFLYLLIPKPNPQRWWNEKICFFSEEAAQSGDYGPKKPKPCFG